MDPFVMGGLLSFGSSLLGGIGSANAAIKQANAQSRAEGAAIAKERMNATIRNSYNTAFGQMQLALRKRQLSQQGTDIKAATLAAKGNADVAQAATGSMGASTAAIAADIEQKSQEALDQTNMEFENAMLNYNNELSMMKLNTQQSEQNVRKIESVGGTSFGSILAGAVLQGGMSFASQYYGAKMQLGLGPAPTAQSSPTGQAYVPQASNYALGGAGTSAGWRINN